MRNLLTFLSLIVILASCDKKSKVEKEVEEVPVKMEVHRFDQAFFKSKPEDLNDLRLEYPFFFPDPSDAPYLERLQDPLWKEVYGEVEKKYGDFEPEQQKIEDLFKHFKYYFPNTKTPVVYTLVGNMDYNSKVLFANDTLVISLELFLGKDHKFYAGEFPEYIRQNFEENQILPDVVSAWSQYKIRPPDNTFLSQMVYIGKQLYLKDLFLPEASDADKIGYTPEQIAWSNENEGYVWAYFIESQMLYSTDQKLSERFLNPAPFSKFYLEIDNQSPGRIGEYIGWQIVKSYMENNEVSVQDLLKTDARTLFEKSKYKPKKNE